MGSKHTKQEKASPTDIENFERDALFECPIDGCTCSFGSETELQNAPRLRYPDMVNEELSKPLFGANYRSESEETERGLAISPWDGH